jgi:hypothetical protein
VYPAPAAAADIRLTDAELEQISQAVTPGAAAGERYPEEGMKGLNA